MKFVWMSDGHPIDPLAFESPGYYDNAELYNTETGECVISAGGGEYDPVKKPADKVFVVTAMNAHDELVAALRQIGGLEKGFYADCPTGRDAGNKAAETARAALAKAGAA